MPDTWPCIITGELLRCLRNVSSVTYVSSSITLILNALLFTLSYTPKEGVPKHSVLTHPLTFINHLNARKTNN